MYCKEIEYKKAIEIGEVEALIASDNLFNLQRDNAYTLKAVLDEYQPTIAGSNFGSDEDYLKIAASIKEALENNNNRPFNIRKILKIGDGGKRKVKSNRKKQGTD